jgi:hypothetical protein
MAALKQDSGSRFFPKGVRKIKEEVTLTAVQAALCQTVLSQALMKVSVLLGSGKEANGDPLGALGERALIDFRAQLQLTLMALGMSSEELADIITPGTEDPQE